MLDPALLRPGRFDRRIVVNRPDVKGRDGILGVHTRKIPLSDDVDMHVLARGTSGFSGADLANLVNEAALNAARYSQKVVQMDDFEFAKDKVLMGSERRSMIISDEEKQITAVHEAGHALLTVLLPTPIHHKVTIIPRGSRWGYPQLSGRRQAQLLARLPQRPDCHPARRTDCGRADERQRHDRRR